MPLIAYACYRRPEFLKVNLMQMLKNPELEKYSVVFCTDIGYDPKTDEVISWFRSKYACKNITVLKMTEHFKNQSVMLATPNIMQGYLYASTNESEYLIPAEEDIIPSTNYLRLIEGTYELILSQSIYERIGWLAHKIRRDEPEGNPAVLIGDYQSTSPCCIPIKVINKYLLPHITNPYWYSNPVGYNHHFFPNSRIPPFSMLDHDCMIERIMENNKLFVLKPDHARSAHIGFYGGPSGNAKGRLLDQLPFDAKVEAINAMIYNTEALKTMALENKHDIIGLPKEKPTDFIMLDPDRIYAKSSSWHYDTNNEFRDYIGTGIHIDAEILLNDIHKRF